MTLQDLGSIGEVAGAVATIITLAYLAVHVRQNSIQMREATRVAKMTAMDRTVEAFSRFRALLSKPENSELYTRGLESYKSLGTSDKVRFRALIEEYFFAYSALYERVSQGAYEQSTWSKQVPVAASVIKQTGGGEWWADRKVIFSHEFISEIERFAGAEHAS